MAQKPVGIALATGHAHAGGRENAAAIVWDAVDCKSFHQRVAQGLRRRRALREQKGKPIAADAEELRFASISLFQAARGVQQDHVAAGIAQTGMDGLEAVQIQQRQIRRTQGIAQCGHCLHQGGTCAKPNQGIAQRRLLFLAVGDVAQTGPGSRTAPPAR